MNIAQHTITIGTRASKLALVQTNIVRGELLGRNPNIEVQIQHITTKGDMILDRPLAAVGGKGLFIDEIENAMRAGRIDMAVHSAKDLPSELPDDMQIIAFLPRADARDVLISRTGGLRDLKSNARVGTSSPRRICQLRALRPDLDILDIRGNVDTRLRKLWNGDYDAIVLAAAGLERLGDTSMVTEWIDPLEMVPAVGQGALAIEVCTANKTVASLVGALNDPPTVTAVLAERAFLATIGGGCAAAVAAHAQLQGDTMTLTGMIGSPDGRKLQDTLAGPTAEGELLGRRLATLLLERGGVDLLQD